MSLGNCWGEGGPKKFLPWWGCECFLELHITLTFFTEGESKKWHSIAQESKIPAKWHFRTTITNNVTFFPVSKLFIFPLTMCAPYLKWQRDWNYHLKHKLFALTSIFPWTWKSYHWLFGMHMNIRNLTDIYSWRFFGCEKQQYKQETQQYIYLWVHFSYKWTLDPGELDNVSAAWCLHSLVKLFELHLLKFHVDFSVEW